MNFTALSKACLTNILLYSIKLLAYSGLFHASQNLAASFPLPLPGSNVIGQLQITFVEPGDSIFKIARRFNIGKQELLQANPHISTSKRLLPWTKLLIPSAFILPNAARSDIIINLPEMRLYYFPKYRPVVFTFPVGIGRENWKTPVVTSWIIKKTAAPSWHVPKSIKQYMEAKGTPLPNVVPPGPNNPLGTHALKLSIPGYLIHGTNQPYSVGQRSSSGCIRMYPEDIIQLFELVNTNTKVQIINQPYKISWESFSLYVEAHPAFQDQLPKNKNNSNLIFLISQAIELTQFEIYLDWETIDQIIKQQPGYPIVISTNHEYFSTPYEL